MKLTFWGAAGGVTGSMHLVESGGRRILLDCGLNQGRRKEADAKNRHLPFAGSSIDAVVLSHAHIDHSGNLPTLVRGGFSGPIYATPATIDLCNWMLRDTAHIQEKDAEFLNKRRDHRKAIGIENGHAEPLYSMADAERTLPLFRPVPYHTRQELGPCLSFESYDAGHILGSAAVVLHEASGARGVRLAFSGDVGRPNAPIIRSPEAMPPVDYLILESTYGGRLHKSLDHVVNRLEAVVNRTAGRGGRIIVPAFAVGRTQQLVLLLHQLANEKRIPNIPIYVDSPLAVNVTDVYRAHPECFNEETRAYLGNHEDPFGFRRLQYIRDAEDSKKLNDLHGPFVVISASGMAEQGRILHHLRNNIEDPRNTVLIAGFMAQDTLGRKLVEKWPEVRIFGEPVRVRAEIASLDELSAHADQSELFDWIRPMVPSLRRVFLVHGEPEQAETLAKLLKSRHNLDAIVAAPGLSFDLSS
ncbi:MAG TPA: MBL fold metallo-hydrolase [Bryobacteraceae bacterium]|jgi:metallo-beta-lactamase family protein|nr:MBL fold metallo-hydrolase [Bryobacteraceae bacterium]